MTSTGEEAARWFAAERRGMMLHSERQAYEAWLRYPANRRAIAALQDIWRDLDAAHGLGNVKPEPDRADAVTRRMTVVQSALVATLFAAMFLGAGVLPKADANDRWTALDWWSR